MEKRYAAIRDQLAMSIALQNKDSQTQNAESAAGERPVPQLAAARCLHPSFADPVHLTRHDTASAQLKVVRIERDKLSKKLQAYEDEIAVVRPTLEAVCSSWSFGGVQALSLEPFCRKEIRAMMPLTHGGCS